MYSPRTTIHWSRTSESTKLSRKHAVLHILKEDFVFFRDEDAREEDSVEGIQCFCSEKERVGQSFYPNKRKPNLSRLSDQAVNKCESAR